MTAKVPTDLTEAQQEDMRARDRAHRMAAALTAYATARYFAYRASVRFDTGGDMADYDFALGFRADARAALHGHEELLAIVERVR